MYNYLDRIPAVCDRRTDRHLTTAESALCIHVTR